MRLITQMKKKTNGKLRLPRVAEGKNSRRVSIRERRRHRARLLISAIEAQA